MISTVVVPLDGSTTSEAALVPARDLSLQMDAAVMLFAAAGDDEPEVRAYLDGVARQFGDRPVTVAVHRGFSSEALAELVRGIPGAAVCMASALSAPPGTLIGAVAEDVLDAGDVPVLLLGPSCAPATGLERDGALVLCADGSAGASAVEPVIAEWGTALDLDVHLVTVLHHADPQLAGAPVDRVLREVSHLGRRLECRGLSVHTEVLDDGLGPALAITAYAAGHPTALIAMSARGHRHTLHPVVGDTVMHVLRLAHVPVLVCQPVPRAFHS
jgi:nucleotide-binding universal stress UspA family protein